MQGIVLASIENTNMILFFKKRKKKKKISDGDSDHSKNTNCYSVFRKKCELCYLYSKKKNTWDLEQNHDNVFYSKVTLNFVTSNDLLYSET